MIIISSLTLFVLHVLHVVSTSVAVVKWKETWSELKRRRIVMTAVVEVLLILEILLFDNDENNDEICLDNEKDSNDWIIVSLMNMVQVR